MSGGVDSMALASLCSQMQRISSAVFRSILLADHNQSADSTPFSRQIKFQAFVVDHGARKSSNLEAQAVLERLEALNIPTRLLKINWGSHERPADLPNFESLARRYRFQALGAACRDLGINGLFLAHHEDDQVETLMMRFIAGHKMRGLAGIPISSEIPECYGLYGVHESGGIDAPRTRLNPTSPRLNAVVSSLMPLPTEFGGVKVYRPLLQFGKERLMATCEADDMEWFEDHTNKDPSVTMRNAVRHMYRSHALPAALSKPALLDLSRKSRAVRLATLEFTNTWLRQSSVKLDTRAGTLKVRFADLSQYNRYGLELDSKCIAVLLLRRIAMLITPREHVGLSSLMGVVERVFPEWFWTRKSRLSTTAFTVAGLQFKVLSPIGPHCVSHNLQKPEWIISRESYKTSTPLPRLEYPPSRGRSIDPIWSEWSLFDGRFWIRIQYRNMSNTMVNIRPLVEQDLAGLGKSSLWKQNRQKMRDLLSDFAPGSIRWTLPAIIARHLDGTESLLALPTLEIGVQNVEKLLDWEVRYKKVDMETLTMSNSG